MKKVFILAAAAALAACSNPNKYVIEGSVEGLEGTAYLVFGAEEVADSVAVVDGKFRFEGEAAEPRSAYLVDSPQHPQSLMLGFFLEPGTITVSVPAEGSRPVATGTIANDAAVAYNKAYAALVEEYRNPETSEERREAVDKAMDQLTADSYAANVGNIFGASMLQDQSYYLSGAELLEEIAKFPAAMQAAEPLAKLKEYGERKVKVDVGQPYIDVAQPDADGQTVTLKSVIENPANKYVLVDFWASWCGPCMREVPYLVKTYKEFHGKGFEIFGISFDTDREKWLNAVKEKELTWVHVSELNRFNCQAGSDYAVNAIPTNYLVDTATGTILARNLRGEEVYAKMAELLGE